MFPEGGDLVSGIPARVYFTAKNTMDKPADVSGRVVDENGAQVATFSSLYNGLGRFEITPAPGKSYFATITKPHGIEGKFPLPGVADSGCTLQAVDDYQSARSELRIGVFCSRDQDVIATAALREKRLSDIAIRVARNKPSVIAFPVPAGSQGAIRVTVFDDKLVPLAERLVYRGRGADLKVTVTSDRSSYSPRDPVGLTVETRDLAGKPVVADLSLAVVDDTVLSFADDKSAHMLARVYLESEMPGQEIEEPNFYFSDDAKAPAAIDLVLGTQGWRRFEWQPVLNPEPAQPVTATGARMDDFAPPPAMEPEAAMNADAEEEAGGEDEPRLAAKPAERRQPVARPAGPPAAAEPMPVGRVQGGLGRIAAGKRGRGAAKGEMADGLFAEDKDWDGDQRQAMGWAPVRVFPAPNYEGRYDGPRTDFRETIHWAPSVVTNEKGTAKVNFFVSDAVTSFRVTAEGVSRGGLPGRTEQLIQSKLPVSLAVKMPLEVSKGDRIKLPVTLTNETDRTYGVEVQSQFGRAFRVAGGIPKMVKLAHKEKKTFFAELEVIGDGKKPEDGLMAVAIDTDNLKDEVERTVRVVPLGFPQEISLSGTVKDNARHEVLLAGALPGSIEATINMYPSPLATMVQGTEAIIREPYGCFEQASSANYPNIMVLSYLEENEAAEPQLVQRTMGLLDKGYNMLTGYESPKKGYEWFGGDPGHEALTAYGLMEFVDMANVYGDVDNAMVKRTRAWLKSRRDGKGGYKKNPRALDSFGRASDEVTNGYIAYALSESGDKQLKPELAYQKKIAGATKDPYLMALAANVLYNLEPAAASTNAALSRLVKMQKEDGSFAGADHSITRSGGDALTIETTSIAALALMKAGDSHTGPVRKAIDWLNEHRSGRGNFSSTQATVLALKAMAEYANISRATQSAGVATVLVNGRRAGRVSFEKGHRGALIFDDLAASLKSGKNVIEIKLNADNPLPYSVAISYRSKMPASSKEAAVRLSTTLDKKKIPMGEGVRMRVAVENVTEQGQPMTLARVGLPGGLTFQTWQLKELVDKKLIDFYETREREVVLYFRSMGPRSKKEIDLQLLATVPGQYVAPASRAYLYYTDELKHWVEPTAVMITR